MAKKRQNFANQLKGILGDDAKSYRTRVNNPQFQAMLSEAGIDPNEYSGSLDQNMQLQKMIKKGWQPKTETPRQNWDNLMEATPSYQVAPSTFNYTQNRIQPMPQNPSQGTAVPGEGWSTNKEDYATYRNPMPQGPMAEAPTWGGTQGNQYADDSDLPELGLDPYLEAIRNDFMRVREPLESEIVAKKGQRFYDNLNKETYAPYSNSNMVPKEGFTQADVDAFYAADTEAIGKKNAARGGPYCASSNSACLAKKGAEFGADPREQALYGLLNTAGAWDTQAIAKRYPDLFDIYDTPQNRSIGVHSKSAGNGHRFWVSTANPQPDGTISTLEGHYNNTYKGPNGELMEGPNLRNEQYDANGRPADGSSNAIYKYIKLKQQLDYPSLANKYPALRPYVGDVTTK